MPLSARVVLPLNEQGCPYVIERDSDRLGVSVGAARKNHKASLMGSVRRTERSASLDLLPVRFTRCGWIPCLNEHSRAEHARPASNACTNREGYPRKNIASNWRRCACNSLYDTQRDRSSCIKHDLQGNEIATVSPASQHSRLNFSTSRNCTDPRIP